MCWVNKAERIILIMKKKVAFSSLIIFTLLIICGGVFLFMWNRNKKDPVPSQSGTLVVNNGTAITEYVVIHFKENANYADLPVTEVLKNLGMTVNWVDSDTAEVVSNDKKYTLNLPKVSLVEFGQDFNLLLPTPGGIRSYKILGQELILDSNTIKSALYQMGEKINIDIDHNKLIINIIKTND